MKKYIRIEEGSYRGSDMSGRIFLLVKDYQRFEAGKDGGFVTVDVKELGGFTGKDKVRVNVPDISLPRYDPVSIFIYFFKKSSLFCFLYYSTDLVEVYQIW